MHFLQEMERSRFHEFKDKHNIKLCLTKIRLYLHCIHSICQRHVYVDTIKMDGRKASDGGCLRFSPWWCFTMFTMFHHGGVWLSCHSLVLAKLMSTFSSASGLNQSLHLHLIWIFPFCEHVDFNRGRSLAAAGEARRPLAILEKSWPAIHSSPLPSRLENTSVRRTRSGESKCILCCAGGWKRKGGFSEYQSLSWGAVELWAIITITDHWIGSSWDPFEKIHIYIHLCHPLERAM